MPEILSNTPYNYSELASKTLSAILSVIQNRDSYSTSVPGEVKPGYSYTYTFSRSHGAHEGGVPVTITFFIGTDSNLSPVPTATITEDYYNFLESRGISTKSNTPLTTKGIINFFNNVSAFCSVRLILVTSQFTESEVVFYKQGEVTYPSVSVPDDTVKVTDADVSSMLASLNSTINNVAKLYAVKYSYSSASSSSSSSSSCSSAYIAYFNLQ